MLVQILKGFSMLMLVVGLTVVTAAVSNGQTAHRVAAEVPFEFIVGGQSLPAGKYIVSSASTGRETLLVRSRDAKKSAIRMTSQADSDRKDARLIFHRYGNSYFLAEVWSGDGTGRQLQKSNLERSMQRELATIASKSDTSGYEIVEVAATLH